MNRPLSYLEISREALRHNISEFQKIVDGHQQLMLVVKANAYGHGLEQVIQATEDLAHVYQVDDIEELRALRQHTSRRTLVLGYIQPPDLAEALALDAELALYDTERLELLAAIATPENPAKIHLKIDALLGRQGILPSALEPFLQQLKATPNVRLSGVYSHFSNLEDTTSHEHALAQIKEYEHAIAIIQEYSFTDFAQHLSSTAGIMVFEGSASSHNLVRLGIGLYGLYPSRQLATQYPSIQLQPALRWVSHLAQVKDIPAGFPVGYGLTYAAPRAMRLGIVPQGYSDGFERHLSNQGTVLVDGARCPVIGRIAMNMCMVDLTSAPHAKAGSEVVLLGTQGNETISADEIADTLDTISYEVIARLNPLLPRLLV